MRRKLEWISPIFLVALLVQIFAPVWAAFAMAAASDPLWSAPICSEVMSGANQNPADRQNNHADCCTFCALAHAPFMPTDARVATSAPHAPPRRISLNCLTEIPSTLPIPHVAQARAPPALF